VWWLYSNTMPCELVVIFFIKYANDHQNHQHLNYENFMRKLTFYHWSSIISQNNLHHKNLNFLCHSYFFFSLIKSTCLLNFYREMKQWPKWKKIEMCMTICRIFMDRQMCVHGWVYFWWVVDTNFVYFMTISKKINGEINFEINCWFGKKLFLLIFWIKT